MSKLQLYLQTQFSPSNDVRAIPEVSPYQTGYFSSDVAVGLGVPLLLKHPHFEGSFLTELNYNYVSGDDDNRGSHRHQLGLRVGWKQHISRWLYLEPKVGLGGNLNWFDFGRGFPLQQEMGLTFNVQGTGGIEIPLGVRTFLDIFGGYFYERSLAGNPFYENHGPLIGLAITTQVSRNRTEPLSPNEVALCPKTICPPPEVKVVEKIVEKPVIVVKEVIVEKVVQGPDVEVEVDPSAERGPLVSLFLFPNQSAVIPLQTSYGPNGQILEEHNYALDAIAAYLKAHTAIKIRLHGYANSTGPENQNRIFSLKRAMAVRDYLVAKGEIPEDRVIVEGEFVYEENKTERRIVDAQGASVHGGADYIFDDTADIRNRCVRFEEIGRVKK